MIHLRHNATGEIVWQRRRAVFLSAIYALVLLFAAAIPALFTSILNIGNEQGNNFSCIYIPAPAEHTDTPAPKHQKTKPASIILPPHIHLDTPSLPAMEADSTMSELTSVETEAEEDDILETNAEALMQIQENPHSSITPATIQKTAQQGKDEYIPPAYQNCPQPPYPVALRRHRKDWRVGVLIHIAPDGKPTEVNITVPSGNTELDRHTRNWILRNWHFSPARTNGVPTASKVSTQLCFTLTR